MVKHDSRLIRFGADLAIQGLIAIVGDHGATPTARVAAARALLEYSNSKKTARAGDAAAPRHIEKVVKIDWGG